MRRFVESLRSGAFARRRGHLDVWQWWVWAVAVGALFIGGSFTASMDTDRQLTRTLCFTCKPYRVEQQQSRLQQRITAMVRAAGLSPDVYQNNIVRPQRLGRESWQVRRHRIVFPTLRALTAFERQLQDHIRAGPFKYLARRKRTDSTITAMAITLGIAGVPTDVMVLVQPHTAEVPTAPNETSTTHADAAVVPARIAIVIDDMGWDLPMAEALLGLNIPLSFALMPQAPYQTQIAAEAQRHGYDVLLHLPMEPHDYPRVNPGKDALLTQMSPHDLSAYLQAALRLLPTAIGVNNHMGSRLTEDEHAMHTVMRNLKQHDLFFLDSRTSSASQAYRIAREVGVKAAQRNVFLDHDSRPEQIAQQFRRLTALAQTRGYAIGIGHPYPATLHALKQALPTLRQAGITLVPVSHLVH